MKKLHIAEVRNHKSNIVIAVIIILHYLRHSKSAFYTYFFAHYIFSPNNNESLSFDGIFAAGDEGLSLQLLFERHFFSSSLDELGNEPLSDEDDKERNYSSVFLTLVLFAFLKCLPINSFFFCFLSSPLALAFA